MTQIRHQLAQMGTGISLVNEPEFLFKEETYRIIGACMEVHKELGHGFREIVYGDAIALEFTQKSIPFEREKEIQCDLQRKKVAAQFLCRLCSV